MSVTPTAAPPSRRRFARRALRWTLALLVALWCVLVAAWLILHWAILPHIDRWRPEVEQRASAALGVAVRIGAIEVRARGWVPAFELRDVVLADDVGRAALKLERVQAALSPESLLAFAPRFAQLLIDGPELEVRRDARGRLFVAGIAFDGAQDSGDGAFADWLFAQHEFAIRGGKLRWIDQQRNAPPLELADVVLVVRNGLRRHQWRIEATPPPAWGERLALTGRFTQSLLARSGDWRRWSGTLYAELPRADLSRLRRYADLPFELREGNGALRAWVEFDHGTARSASADLALADVELRLAPNVEPLAFARIAGRFEASRDADGVRFAAERFGFSTANGIEWPAGRLGLSLRQRDGAAPDGGEFSADRIDLALAAGIALKLPLGDTLRALLAETQPKGIVNALQARWDGALDAPQRYSASARIDGLSIAPRAAPQGIGRPGVVNADVELRASERGGDAKLAIVDGTLSFPGVFEQPELAVQRLDAQLDWRIERRADTAPQLDVQLRRARFANADAAGDASGSWRTGVGAGFARGGRYPGQLALDARLERARAVAAARYLPLGIPQPVRRYVEHAVKGGSATQATFRIKGDLWDFPFHNSRTGELRIAASLKDLEFDYVPSRPANGTEPAFASPWPGMTQLSGELLFERGGMQIRDARTRLGGIELSQVNGGIADLAADPTLALDGSGSGLLADGLRFVNETPIGRWIQGALSQSTSTGAAELKLALRLPLRDLARSSVNGVLVLAGSDVRLRPELPLLGNARGKVEFSRNGFSIVGGAARVLGGDATFDGGTQADGSLRFNGQGSASAEGLRRAAELPLLARAAAQLSGQTAYRLSLGFVRGGTELSVTSNLVGIASRWPAPFAKNAETPLPLRYQTTLERDASSRDASSRDTPSRDTPSHDASRDTLRFELGQLVQAHYTRDISGDTPRVLRGGLGIGDAAPVPAAGVHAAVALGAVDAGHMQSALGVLFGAGEAGEGAGYAPTQIALRADELVADGRKLTKLVAGVSFAGGAWRANLDADQLDGYVEWRPAAGGPGRVYARLARLALPQSEAQSIDTLLDAEPANVPALDIVVGDFELRGKKLGRLEVDAQNRSNAAGQREWRLGKLALTMPEAQFSANGQSQLDGARAKRRLQLEFQLDIADSGALLERLGFGRVLRNGKGRLGGTVGWDGSPLAFDPATLSGNVAVAIESGQFLKVDPGVGRLLGVLSLQALPRRLVLDFRDVFQQGFAFDDIAGDIRIDDGVARTNNLRMRGVQAAVLMEGAADLGRETQDLRVVVVPEVNAATASLAYAVINPAIGLGTFLAQLFLRRPLAQAATREFRITGPWAEPKVERIERATGAPLSETPAAAAAPRTP